MSTLFVVATPIGNLGDMTQRAIEVLSEVSTVAAEDTRRSRQLLTHFGITQKRLRSLHAHSSDAEVANLLELLQQADIALLSDAGTPVVSDPGERLIRAAIAAGHRVVPLPGASAVLAALAGSGLCGAGFRFVGFLPQTGGARQRALVKIAETEETVVLFEAPSRTNATLGELADRQPERRACVARELTKLHEEFARGTLQELAQAPREWLGEIAIVLEPWEDGPGAAPSDEQLDARIDVELAKGTHPKTIAEMLAGWAMRPKRAIYARITERKS